MLPCGKYHGHGTLLKGDCGGPGGIIQPPLNGHTLDVCDGSVEQVALPSRTPLMVEAGRT
jgi:hypothetical protein